MPDWNPKDHHIVVGKRIEDSFTLLQEQFGMKVPLDEYFNAYETLADSVYQQCSLTDGLVDFLKRIQDENMQIAIASSANTARITHALKAFQIDHYIETITAAEDLEGAPGKPDPTVYLLSAKSISVDPADCMVIEDAENGVRAAKAAGMYCVGFRNGVNDSQDLSSADVVVSTFDEISL